MPMTRRSVPAREHASRPLSDSLKPEAAVVLRQFRVVFNAIRSHFQRIEKQSGIGGAQVWALSTVAQRPGIGVGELAVAMDVHQSTASNLVRSLVSRGLVESSRDAADRRSVRLRVSEAGAAVLARSPAPFAGLLPEALSQLDGETLARLEADLTTLIVALDLDPNGKAAQTPLAQL